MLAAGIPVHIVGLWVGGIVLTVLGAPVFTSLLWGFPSRSLRVATDGDPDAEPLAASIEHDDLPSVMLLPPLQRIYDLRPGRWLHQIGVDVPELYLRVAVQMPGPPARRLDGQVATVVRGDAREEWLSRNLEGLPFTAWLRERHEEWNWAEPHCSWAVHGSGNPDLTELILAPGCAEPDRPRRLVARCGLLTGWAYPQGGSHTALRVALDALLNVSRRDEQPRSGQTGHCSRTQPSPGALSLDETAGFLLRLNDATELGRLAARHLLGWEDDVDAGQIGMWLCLDQAGVELNQVIDLRGLRRVAGAAVIPEHAAAATLPLPTGAARTTPIGNYVADFLYEMLEHAGYRGMQGRFEQVRRQN